jgi:hypothetical protein
MDARPNTIAAVPAHHAGILHPRLKGGEQAAALPTPATCSPTAPSPRATTSCDAKAADKRPVCGPSHAVPSPPFRRMSRS